MFQPSDRPPLVPLQLTGCLVILLILSALILVPLLLVELAHTALTNLHLTPSAAMLVLLGMLFGSIFNIPIHRRPLDRDVLVPTFEPMGGWVLFPRYQRMRQEQVIAVNVGGCVIPVLLALWLLHFLIDGGANVVTVLLLGVCVNTVACYRMARPIPRVGIALPVFLPALIALSMVWLGLQAEDQQAYRAPVAFVIGISGPLLGADLLHWRDFARIEAGTISIGGAGTWDGIVLSGLLAALFA